MHKDFPVSWEEMHRNSKALAWRLLEEGRKNSGWKGIVGITRGGMVPACIIARELDIKMVETFCISSYDHQDQRQAQIIKQPAGIGDGAGWIVVDDLVDTGSTFKIAREYFPKAHYCCLYAKPAGAKETDSFITEVSQDTWIHFPWDMDFQYSAPIAGR